MRFAFAQNTISMDPFALVVYASLATLRTLELQEQLLACLNFTLDLEDLFSLTKTSDFYELWQQHTLLSTIEMSEV